MNSMIERIARSICYNVRARMWECTCESPAGCREWKDRYDDVACDVLKEMREPTEAMLDAGADEGWDAGPLLCYRAMIEAACSEEK